MKKIILILAVLVMAFASCNESNRRHVYDEETGEVSGKTIKLAPIRSYKLGGASMATRYFFIYNIEGELWYEYVYGEASSIRKLPITNIDDEGDDLSDLAVGDTDDGV